METTIIYWGNIRVIVGFSSFCPPPARRLDAVVPDKFKGYERVLGWHAEVHQWKPLQRVGTLPSRDSEGGDRRPRAAEAQVRALWEG